jgi:hypothetical protein
MQAMFTRGFFHIRHEWLARFFVIRAVGDQSFEAQGGYGG